MRSTFTEKFITKISYMGRGGKKRAFNDLKISVAIIGGFNFR